MSATAIHGSNLHSSETQASVHRRATFDVYEPPRPQPQPRRASTRQDLRRVSVLSRINSRVPTISDLRHTLSAQMQPSKRLRNPPGFWRGVRSIITTSWLNILLVFIPISWATYFALPHTNSNDTLIFIFSFLAIIPLAKLLAFATDELSMRVGQTLAGLLNATLGNAVELIVAIIALVKCELQVLQSSLVGSILSNLLLVLGMCFFAGGLKFSEQGFGMSATQLNSSLLTVSVIAVLLPAAFHLSAGAETPDQKEAEDYLSFSRGAAIILLFIYGSYLVFQLFSHKSLYENTNDVFKSTKYPARAPGDKNKWLHLPDGKWLHSHPKSQEYPNGSAEPLSPTGTTSAEPAVAHSETETANANSDAAANEHLEGSQLDIPRVNSDPERGNESEEEEEVETPQLTVSLTVALLVSVTVLVAVTAEWLVDSINGLTATGNISREFVGLILLPIVGNAAEHVTAVTVSIKDKLTLSLGVAVGSSIQIALFVIPFTIVLAWIIGKPLTLLFDPFESIVLFLSVLVVNYTVQDGKSNWLEGMILMCLYVIIAVVFWYYPGVSISQELATQVLSC
ncbi:hypothetical protein AcW1_008265 [Taiwanofungus camphoratus]|nr:hypothetical protein AcV5_008562 [Antrodia cinnamomea]KAI0951154.1 hypothetical protein AcW1_008265 [Antrodia cinnamomea]